ncbi:glycerol-3-phosphate dehydrogenase/oxidase [Microbulbifer hydrolyticus]|uniref:FAD-dependent oxidoreductase n=1 Tax=Microbulbifer hydrolyticus TaxID=48074 RepID=A0A6P1TDS1_9GAMM|nr:FAD-dependent oxidoreductase [Microbulbifer hydrolyticus]MBB5212324.1 glycerol-3-phosphate dehydrogenase [Microbulbifer hydrolyticus]QHQ39971.1 FAD-dependent oxidoreductase [Microbulbifer hydrolyticus]
MSMEYDVLVVGAGIQGAGVAEALTAEGHRVAILEQESIAHGTSSRSSKLIHGGLRYLESGQFSLVYECLKERRWLLANKPDLVHMVPFLIPVYRHSRRPAWKIRLGLSLYALLAGLFSSQSRFRSISLQDYDALCGLNGDDLLAVYRYYDAQTDDAALTREVIQSALRGGAELICPGSLVGAEVTDKFVRVDYFHEGLLNTLHCRALVNCSGPWIEDTNSKCSPSAKLPPLELVAGTHIQVPLKLANKIFYVEAEDGRAIFVMPWQGETLVGTTERPYHGDPSEVAPTLEEKAYLLRTLKQYFPETRPLQLNELSDSFAGLRVLPLANSNPFSRSRETMICSDNPKRPRIVAVAGGKLTSYRATARSVVKKLRPLLADEEDWAPAVASQEADAEVSAKERNL